MSSGTIPNNMFQSYMEFCLTFEGHDQSTVRLAAQSVLPFGREHLTVLTARDSCGNLVRVHPETLRNLRSSVGFCAHVNADQYWGGATREGLTAFIVLL